MTDWATRASTPENPIREMQSPAPAVDDDATIAAIRRILCDQEHLLPPDVTASLARRNAAAEPAPEPRKPSIISALRGLRR
ncbi:MAG: hypothetical protein KDK02_09565 [Rhodobacteraceae bacterium]|nr:hypothetical protein [Paracoccaceae bacterium]